MSAPRVIGAEAVEGARQLGRLIVEVMPGDIVTALARETAERLGLRLVDGPVEMPTPVRTDGATSMRRGGSRPPREGGGPAPGGGPAQIGRRGGGGRGEQHGGARAL